MAAQVKIIARDRRDTLGEGLLWSARDDALYWVDILGRRLHRMTLDDEAITGWDMPDTIGWLVERESGGFVAGIGRAFAALSLDPFAIETIAAPEPERDGNRFNDAKADAAGRIFAGSMPFGCDRPSGSFYRLDPGGAVTRLEEGYTIPNGPAIGDGFLLHTDTALDTIFRYPINDDGSLGRRAPFVTFDAGDGHPDGMTIDADGFLWVACWGASCVRRYDPSGRHDRGIALPASQITNVTFAGAGLDRMFVTSAAEGVDEPHAGCLFEVDAGCRGRAPYRFAG